MNALCGLCSRGGGQASEVVLKGKCSARPRNMHGEK